LADEIDIAWRDAFPYSERENDYVAFHGEKQIGRVYIDAPGHRPPQWRGFIGSTVFTCRSRREAMLAVENSYIEAQKRQKTRHLSAAGQYVHEVLGFGLRARR